MKNFWIRCISAVIVLVVAAILAFVVKRPALDNSVAAWLPQRSAQIRAFQNFKANFKNDEVILLRISNATAKQRYRFLELVGETFEIADSEADDDQSDETAEETTDETTEEASDEAEEQESAADATDQAAETVVTARARSITSALTVFPDAFDVLSEESLGGFSKQNWRYCSLFINPFCT